MQALTTSTTIQVRHQGHSVESRVPATMTEHSGGWSCDEHFEAHTRLFCEAQDAEQQGIQVTKVSWNTMVSLFHQQRRGWGGVGYTTKPGTPNRGLFFYANSPRGQVVGYRD